MPKLRYHGRDKDGNPIWREPSPDDRTTTRRMSAWEVEDEPINRAVLRGYRDAELRGKFNSGFRAHRIKEIWAE